MRESYFEIEVYSRINKFKPQKEYKFLNDRRFRFDFAWPEIKLAIECEGGIFTRGRHTRGIGFTKDCEKYNLAVKSGWRVLRYAPSMIDEILPDLKQFGMM